MCLECQRYNTKYRVFRCSNLYKVRKRSVREVVRSIVHLRQSGFFYPFIWCRNNVEFSRFGSGGCEQLHSRPQQLIREPQRCGRPQKNPRIWKTGSYLFNYPQDAGFAHSWDDRYPILSFFVNLNEPTQYEDPPSYNEAMGFLKHQEIKKCEKSCKNY